MAPKTDLKAHGVDLATHFGDFRRASKIIDLSIPLRPKKKEKLAQDAAKRLKKIPESWAA